MSIEELTVQWGMAKHVENDAKAQRLEIEEKIASQVGDLKIGTNTYGNLKIVCKNYRKWDQEQLADAKESWGNETFPFKIEYKEVVADTKELSVQNNTKLRELESKCLTITPAKPSFAIKG